MSALSPQSSKLAFVFAAGLGCVTACMCGRCIFTENKIRWTHVMDGIRKYQSIRSHSIVFKMECQCRYRLCYYIRTSTNEIEIRRYESHGKWTVANQMVCCVTVITLTIYFRWEKSLAVRRCGVNAFTEKLTLHQWSGSRMLNHCISGHGNICTT